jgi:WD40 repeat protein
VFRERKRTPLEHPTLSFVWTLRFGPPNGQLFTDGGQRVRVWDLGETGSPTFRDLVPPKENRIIDEKVDIRLGGFDRGGRRVLTLGNDGGMAVWDLENPTASPRSLGDKPHGPGQPFADWNSTRDVIATGGADGVVRLWRPDGARWSGHDLRHPSSVEVLAFSSDGLWLATGCRDGGVRLWSIDGGAWTGAGWYHAGPVTRVQFSPDGRRLLSASRDGTARVVAIPAPEPGEPGAILATLEAEAGIHVAAEGGGTTASDTPPQPLTLKMFRERRPAPGSEPRTPERSLAP